jgi:hypothetical protein
MFTSKDKRELWNKSNDITRGCCDTCGRTLKVMEDSDADGFVGFICKKCFIESNYHECWEDPTTCDCKLE